MHQKLLNRISADVGTLSSRAVQALPLPSETNSAALALTSRISKLENAQRKVSRSSHRALSTAIHVHRQQQTNTEKHSWMNSLETTELEQNWENRCREQEANIDRILHMVDMLADKVLLSDGVGAQRALTDGAEASTGQGGDTLALAADIRDQGDAVDELRDKVHELEAAVNYGLAAQSYTRPAVADSAATSSGQPSDSLLPMVHDIELRMDSGFSDMCRRLDALQESKDQVRTQLRQVSRQIPDMNQRVEQLWVQCQHYFPKVKEHDVNFSFLIPKIETLKQHMLDVGDSLGRHKFRDGGSEIGASLWEGSADGAEMSGPLTACEPTALNPDRARAAGYAARLNES